MTFSMKGAAPTSNKADQDPGATEPTPPPLTSGKYVLTVWLTNKISSATDEPVYKIGESVATTRTFFINAPLPMTHKLSLNASEFSPTVGGPVTMYPGGGLPALDKGQQIECAWSPWGASAPVPPFKAQKGDTKLKNLLPPVLGKSIFKCQETNGCKLMTQADFLELILAIIAGDETWDDTQPALIGNVGTNSEDFPLLSEPALPSGTALDVTCWADSKDSDLGGVVDDGGTGKLSVGDSYGRTVNKTSGTNFDVKLNVFTD
jgi:hypothetical protein